MSNTADPRSSLVDVIQYLKSNDGGIPGTPTPTSAMKELSTQDRLDLRHSLDKVKGLA